MKLIGAIFIICASICASFFYEKGLKEKINNHTALNELVLHMKSQIDYFEKPICEIFKDFYIENEVIKEITEKKELSNFSWVDISVRKEICSLFSAIGKGYKKEQLSLCDYTSKLLSSCIEKMKLEFSKKAKVYRSLSLFIGFSAVILLV